MDKNIQKRRFVIFIVATLMITLTVVYQYASIMLFDLDDHTGIIASPVIERGPILDRNGEILAIQNRLYTVEAWIPSIKNPAETAHLLAETLNLDENNILGEFINEERSSFMYIKRKISSEESDQIERYFSQGKLLGITMRPEFSRNYPENSLASHLIGFVGIDNNGLSGIEYTLNNILMPQEEEITEVGKSEGDLFGSQVFLTIDLDIQYIVEDITRKALEENKATSATILVMGAKTGEILAYSSFPTFNPNDINESSLEDRRNRPIDMTFEPGSVFKIFSIASIMDIGGINPDSHFTCDGTYNHTLSNGTEISIGCQGIHGSVTPELILYYSCNAGAAYASETVSETDFYNKLMDLGFGRRTEIPLSGESAGILTPPENWSIRTKPTIAFGQEIGVSAIQMITAATAIANHGIVLEPHIISRVINADGTVENEYNPRALRRALSAETADSVLSMMTTVTSPGGGAYKAAVEGISIAAKTGTAELLDPLTGIYSSEDFIASCLAIFPAEDPQWIVYTVIEKPKGDSYWGGTIAAPVVKDIVNRLAILSDIPVAGQQEIIYPNQIVLPSLEDFTITDTIPDFTGASKRQLLPLLSRDDIEVSIEGNGWTVTQTPIAGTPFVEGMTLKLKLE